MSAFIDSCSGNVFGLPPHWEVLWFSLGFFKAEFVLGFSFYQIICLNIVIIFLQEKKKAFGFFLVFALLHVFGFIII